MAWQDEGYWRPVDEPSPEYTDAELNEAVAELDANWTPEDQAVLEQDLAERRARRAAGPDEDWPDMALRFAQGVQTIYDRTGEPCRMVAAGAETGIHADDVMLYAVAASLKGLVRHPVRDDCENISFWLPAVG